MEVSRLLAWASISMSRLMIMPTNVESICFLLSRALFFRFLPGLFLSPTKSLPFLSAITPGKPAQHTNTPPTFLQNSRTGKLWRIAAEDLSLGQPSHPLASDNGQERGGWREFLEKMTGQIMTSSLISVAFLSLFLPKTIPTLKTVGIRTHKVVAHLLAFWLDAESLALLMALDRLMNYCNCHLFDKDNTHFIRLL